MWNRGVTTFIRIGLERYEDALDRFLQTIGRNYWRLDQAMAELPDELGTLIAPIIVAASNARIPQYERAQAFLDEGAHQKAAHHETEHSPDHLAWLDELMPNRT